MEVNSVCMLREVSVPMDEVSGAFLQHKNNPSQGAAGNRWNWRHTELFPPAHTLSPVLTIALAVKEKQIS